MELKKFKTHMKRNSIPKIFYYSEKNLLIIRSDLNGSLYIYGYHVFFSNWNPSTKKHIVLYE